MVSLTSVITDSNRFGPTGPTLTSLSTDRAQRWTKKYILAHNHVCTQVSISISLHALFGELANAMASEQDSDMHTKAELLQFVMQSRVGQAEQKLQTVFSKMSLP